MSTQLSGIDLPGLFAFPCMGSPVSNGLGHQNHTMSPRAHCNAPEASYAEAGSRHNPASRLRPYPGEAIEVAIPEVPRGRSRVNSGFDTKVPFLQESVDAALAIWSWINSAQSGVLQAQPGRAHWVSRENLSGSCGTPQVSQSWADVRSWE